MPPGAETRPPRFDDAVKRTCDCLIALVAMVLGAPVWVLISWRIKREDGGPVFFRQPRLGRGGAPFSMWKFRTMRQHAPDLRNPDGSTFNAEDDPRVTRVGRFLRKSSLDELPQLLNVLAGDMSLVGPRPDLLDARQHYRPEDHARLSVRPGLTGWAQIMGRNDMDWLARRDLDLEYVRRRSFLFDLGILLRTVPMVLRQKGVFGRSTSAR